MNPGCCIIVYPLKANSSVLKFCIYGQVADRDRQQSPPPNRNGYLSHLCTPMGCLIYTIGSITKTISYGGAIMTTTNTFLRGQKAFLGGDLVYSIQAFSDALEQGEHPFHSHLNRGIAYLKIGQFEQAIEDFDLILKRDVFHEQALFYRGVAKLNLEENEEAIHDLDRSLVLNPDRGVAYLARGLAHHALGHWDEVEKNIHDNHALNGVELGGFMEDYILSDALFGRILKFFEKDNGKWRLSLTEDEIQRMATLH
jgi:tetratricopeptide (TPR) repeat protein